MQARAKTSVQREAHGYTKDCGTFVDDPALEEGARGFTVNAFYVGYEIAMRGTDKCNTVIRMPAACPQMHLFEHLCCKMTFALAASRGRPTFTLTFEYSKALTALVLNQL